jgi:transaldolase
MCVCVCQHNIYLNTYTLRTNCIHTNTHIDAMATEKLSEGIRNFAKDIETLEGQIRAKLSA